MSRSLIVLPDDSAQPLLDAIKGAKSSLHVKMFIYSDAALLGEVLAAHRRGFKMQIIPAKQTDASPRCC